VKIPILPFLVAPSEAVTQGIWQQYSAGSWISLPAAQAQWDYLTLIRMSVKLDIDTQVLLERCELAEGSALEVIVRAKSKGTSAVARLEKIPVDSGCNFSQVIETKILGTDLGGELTVETLVVATNPEPLTSKAAHRAGSILWRSSQSTRLQGDGAQFPTEAVDFAAIGLSDHAAAWYLSVELDDPEALFMSSVRVYLNLGLPIVQELLAGASSEQVDQLRRTLLWDVTRQLVVLGLNNPEVQELRFDEAAISIAGVLRNLLAYVWPTTPLETVGNWLIDDPGRVERRLQQYCGLIPL
jgi:hypothetical protein